MAFIALNDLEKQNSISGQIIDFIFTFDFPASSKFINRALKNGGIVTVLLNDNPSAGFYKPSNNKIAYLRRFDLTAVAMRKTDLTEAQHATQGKLFSTSEAKKAALQKLEDVLLEIFSSLEIERISEAFPSRRKVYNGRRFNRNSAK